MLDELETTLSVRAYIKKIDEKILGLTGLLIANGMGTPAQDNITRGKILAFREAKDILLNTNHN